MIKKKRGRKPKNNIIHNENPIFDNINNEENLIVCIKNNGNNNNKNKTKIDENSYNDNNNYSFINDENLQSISLSSELCCWNCCDKISTNISYPILYENNTFHTNGNFCSYECAGRYIFDTFTGKDLFEKYNLLNFFYYKNTNNKSCIKIPPSRLKLKKFGGELDKLDYINSKDYISYDGYLPPVIPVNNIFYKNEIINSNNNNQYKLYRNKSLINQNIKDKL